MSEIHERLSKKISHLKIAVVHDWIFTRRGGEKVLEQILDLFPQADLYYLFGNPQKYLQTQNKHKLFPSFLSIIPGIQKFYKLLLPLFPVAIESFNFSEYDLVISSSSCVAKGIIPPPLGIHISYIHSPMRYAWDQEFQYFKKSPSFFRPLEIFRRILLNKLRIWDVTSAYRNDVLITNSHFVARRCSLFYKQKSIIIYPPVDVGPFLSLQNSLQQYQSEKKVLLFGAWMPYKKMYESLKLLIEHKIPVIAAGQGELLELAAKKFRGQAEFILNPKDAELPTLYKRAHALLFPAIEDFGIIPLEATASGIWVVAPSQGGTAETVVENETGFTFQLNNEHSLLEAVKSALNKEINTNDKENMRKHVERFTKLVFQEKIANIVLEKLEK